MGVAVRETNVKLNEETLAEREEKLNAGEASCADRETVLMTSLDGIRELAKSWSHKLLGIAQRCGSDESVQIITREIERIPAMDEQECLKTIQTFKDAVEQLHETETRQAGQET